MHFFADGRPAHLCDWHVLFRDGDRLAPQRAASCPTTSTRPLFSDYAHKLRTVWMPPGTAAKYEATQSFDFPVGTILTKTFYYPRAGAACQGRGTHLRRSRRTSPARVWTWPHVRLIETRMLVRREHGWEALPYVWNAAQTDAELARTGDEVPLELVAAGEANEAFTYVVPEREPVRRLPCDRCAAARRSRRSGSRRAT